MENKFSKKLTIFVLGILAALLVIEGVLRSIGLVSTFVYDPEVKKNQAQYTIMTLGNSFTYGVGAPPGKSYPDQLNEMLQKRTEKTYQVINRGKTNANTTLIMENLDLWLKQDKPDMVFLMVGEPNHWNKYGYWSFVDQRGGHTKKGILDYLDFLRWSKTYKFFELLANKNENRDGLNKGYYSVVFRTTPLDEKHRLQLGYQWIAGFQNGSFIDLERLSPEEQAEAGLVLQYVFNHDKNPIAAYYLAEIAMLYKKDAKTSIRLIGDSINNSDNFDVNQWFFLTKNKELFLSLHEEKFNELIVKLKSKIDPAFLPVLIKTMNTVQEHTLKTLGGELAYKINFYNPVHTGVAKIYVYNKSDEEPVKTFEVVERTLKVNPFSYNANFIDYAAEISVRRPELKERYHKLLSWIEERALGLDMKNIFDQGDLEREWIIHDLEVMIAKIKSSGAKVIVQTYPPTKRGSARVADVILRNWWNERPDKKSIQFLDTTRLLEKDLSAKKGGNKYYSVGLGDNDDHLNAEGYGLVARLMEAIVP